MVGWEVTKTEQIFLPDYPGSDVAIHPKDSLYNPRHMALAWRVLNWGMTYPMLDDDKYQFVAKLNFSISWGDVFKSPPGEAQAIWLDKLLEAAIEAGLISFEVM